MRTVATSAAINEPACMFEAWQLELIDHERVAHLGTIAADGRPHLVPVCYALLEDRFVIAIDEKPKRSTRPARIANIEWDSHVSLLADRYDDDWSRLAWVRVDGEAQVLARGDKWSPALAALRARYPQYGTMALEALPLIVVTPQRVTGWRWSGDGGV